MNRSWPSGAALGLLAFLVLVPWGAGRAAAQATDTVSVQLKWHHQTQFAGVYVADQKGFYRTHNLRVEHRPWQVGAASPVEDVVAGKATFGITSHTEFLVARANGAPVVAVAAVYQKSPVGFFALRRSGIKHPKDFVGKSIAFAPTHEIHLAAMMKRLGLDLASVRRVPYGFDLSPFYRGDVAIWAGYVMNQPVDARLAGHDVTTIFPDDYGVHTYDDILFGSANLIARDPALVERWLRATLQGWRYAVEHADEATEITLKVDPTLRREKQLAMLLASIPLIHTGQFPIGWMRKEVWETAHQILLDQRILPRPVPLEPAYAPRFVERISGR